jgi:hypothetical protein
VKQFPERVSRETIEILAVQMSDARRAWAAQPEGSVVSAPRELMLHLADSMLVLAYELLDWPQEQS